MELGLKVRYGDRIGVITMADRNLGKRGVEVTFEATNETPEEIGYFDFGGNPHFKDATFEGKLEILK